MTTAEVGAAITTWFLDLPSKLDRVNWWHIFLLCMLWYMARTLTQIANTLWSIDDRLRRQQSNE